jgi:KDO2-lipid IV(A) lauroyltransferase
MKALFYIFTVIPISLIRRLITIIFYTGIYKLLKSYKVTLINLNIAYKDKSPNELQVLAKQSLIETIVSGYETMCSWSRPIHKSGKNIFRVDNNFLINNYLRENNGLALIAIHNRSVDMLLKWINANTKTTTLYKKIKIEILDRFVRKQREENNNEVYETDINGVRKIFKAFKQNKVICIAADQVPQRGMGEYIDLFGMEAYTTTLAPSLVYKTQKPAVFLCMNSNKENDLIITIKPCKNNIYNESEHKLSLNKSIEELININPIDYSWEYKRYRRQISGTDPYKDV